MSFLGAYLCFPEDGYLIPIMIAVMNVVYSMIVFNGLNVAWPFRWTGLIANYAFKFYLYVRIPLILSIWNIGLGLLSLLFFIIIIALEMWRYNRIKK